MGRLENEKDGGIILRNDKFDPRMIISTSTRQVWTQMLSWDWEKITAMSLSVSEMPSLEDCSAIIRDRTSVPTSKN